MKVNKNVVGILEGLNVRKTVVNEKKSEIDEWIAELSKSGVENVQKILKFTGSKDWQKIEKKILDKYGKGEIDSYESLENYVNTNYDAEDFNK
jgi:hypothetical protein